MLVGFVGAQFLPDVIHVPKRWPPRLPRVEFVREGATSTPLPEPAPIVAAPDTVAPALPPVAAAPSLDAAEAARRAKLAEAKPVKRAKPKPKAKVLPEEDGAWFSTEPTAMIVPVHITTQIELSGSSREIPVPAASEPRRGDEWPVVCGVVVDASGAAIEGAEVRIEGSDVSDRTDKDGRFCLASPVRKPTLAVSAGGRDSVRYVAELEGPQTQVRVTLQ
jgi:hypothetical protein